MFLECTCTSCKWLRHRGAAGQVAARAGWLSAGTALLQAQLVNKQAELSAKVAEEQRLKSQVTHAKRMTDLCNPDKLSNADLREKVTKDKERLEELEQSHSKHQVSHLRCCSFASITFGLVQKSQYNLVSCEAVPTADSFHLLAIGQSLQTCALHSILGKFHEWPWYGIAI